MFTWTKGLIAVLVFASSVALSFAQERPAGFDFGRHEYEDHCASCHGATGRGDGVNKPYLSKSPSDLTTLSKRNEGEFPYEHVYAVVDGRQEPEANGPRDMPIYGAEYSAEAAGDYLDTPYSTERYVETRLVALVDHLHSLQVK